MWRTKVRFGEKNELLEQKLLTPKEKGWSCNTCGKLLGKKLKMKNHVEIHNRNFIHVCTFCEKEFGTNNGLQLHVYSKDRDNSTASPELKEKVHSTEIWWLVWSVLVGKYNLATHKEQGIPIFWYLYHQLSGLWQEEGRARFAPRAPDLLSREWKTMIFQIFTSS